MSSVSRCFPVVHRCIPEVRGQTVSITTNVNGIARAGRSALRFCTEDSVVFGDISFVTAVCTFFGGKKYYQDSRKSRQMCHTYSILGQTVGKE